MTAVVTGDREIALGYEQFPEALRERMRGRMQSIIDRLEGRSREEAPYKTGELRSEITGRVYADNPQRVAGYVQVVAPGSSEEYRKAGALEYGVDKVRRSPAQLREGRDLLGRFNPLRLEERVSSGVVHQRAFRYLREPLEEMRSEIEAELANVVDTQRLP